jgi:hypothetical protein
MVCNPTGSSEEGAITEKRIPAGSPGFVAWIALVLSRRHASLLIFGRRNERRITSFMSYFALLFPKEEQRSF